MVDILMATYNGEKYIESQLTSIISQTYKDWRLFIQDDLSTDYTLKIIKKYQTIDKRIILVDNTKKRGCGRNFLSLLSYSTSEYICFADQDDYWFENKLERLVNEITLYDKENECPKLVVSNCLLWKYPQNSIFYNPNFVKPNAIHQALFMGGMQGCLTLFNSKLRDILNKNFDYIWLHDHYLLLSAITFGQIYYINDPLMLYRQHENNVTPHFTTGLLSKVINKLKGSNALLDRRLYLENKEFYRLNIGSMPEEISTVFRNYFKLESMKPLFRKLKLICSNYTIADSSHLYFVIKVLMKRKFIGEQR